MTPVFRPAPYGYRYCYSRRVDTIDNKSKDGKAKPYQVRQVLKAIDKLQEEQK